MLLQLLQPTVPPGCWLRPAWHAQAVAVEADTVHEALVEEAGSQPLLQPHSPSARATRDDGGHKAPVEPRVSAPCLQLPLSCSRVFTTSRGLNTGQATG